MQLVQKAFAYVVRRNQLLVFSQPQFPSAGLQVPAGTIEHGEPPERAVLREVQEETGLRDVTLLRQLGITQFDARVIGKEQIHERYFFLLSANDAAPERWTHFEQHSGDSQPIEFAFFWMPVSDAKQRLAADHGAMLHLTDQVK
ncbi:MAG: NUDIX hydrolase [Burkholderiaceae bacterium]